MSLAVCVARGPRLLRAFPRGALWAASAALALAACTDRSPLASPIDPPVDVRETRLACTADLTAGTLHCGSAEAGGGGASRALILGGQDVYLRLSSEGTTYDGSAYLESQVSVQNLLSQPLGTSDGTLVEGVRVYFATPPAVTGGSGVVEVDNTDGTSAFTGSGQPYFHYEEILEPRGMSQAKTWRFRVPPTVETFSFTLLVQATAPAEAGVLQWSMLRYPDRGVAGILFDVWGTSRNNVFAVGQFGMLFHFDGVEWSVVPTTFFSDLNAVSGVGPRAVIVVGYGGSIFRYDGNRWSQVEAATLRNLVDVWGGPTSVAVGWMRNQGTGRLQALVRRSVDAGLTWDERTIPDSLDLYANAVWGISATRMIAVGSRHYAAEGRYEAMVFRSADAGQTWEATPAPYAGSRILYGVWSRTTTEVIAVGQQRETASSPWQGVILRSNDGGATWSTLVSAHPAERILEDVWGRGDTVFVSGWQTNLTTGVREGLVFTSIDGGDTWSSEILPERVRAMWSGGEGHTYAVGANGMIRRLGTEGPTTPVNIELAAALEDVWTSDGTSIIAVGSRSNPTTPYQDAVLLRSADGGASWRTSVYAGTGSTGLGLHSVWGSSAQDVWAVGVEGDHGIVLRSTDGGASWTRIRQFLSDMYSVTGRSAADILVVGRRTNSVTKREDAAIHRTRNGGTSWTTTTLSRPTASTTLYDLVVRGDTIVAVGVQYDHSTGEGGAAFLRSTDDGATWTFLVPETPLSGVNATLHSIWAGSGRMVAVGDRRAASGTEGVVFESADGGATWSLVHVVTTEAGRSTALNSVWGAAPDEVYITGNTGKLYRSSGARWIEMAVPTRERLMSVHGNGSSSVFAVGASGAILRGHR